MSTQNVFSQRSNHGIRQQAPPVLSQVVVNDGDGQSQVSITQGGSVANTGVSLQRQNLGSLFAGATLNDCVIHINLHK